MQNKSIRILYLLPGLVPPRTDHLLDKMHYLSSRLSGDVLLPVWWRDSKEALERLGDGGFPQYRVSRFTYHMFLAYRYPAFIRSLAILFFFLSSGLRLKRSGNNYGVIVTYGFALTGAAGLLLKLFTGTRLIVELPGVPDDAYRYDSPQFSAGLRAKKFFSDLLLQIVAGGADHLRLLFPDQLKPYPRLASKPNSAFHDFVPIGRIELSKRDEKFVLLLGTPWYIKGVDLLIEAFIRIKHIIPDYKLIVVGHVPDRSALDRLIGSENSIEIRPAVNYQQALDLIQRCSVYSLASRTEGLPRVIIEAMAAGKPVVATAVGGIPHYCAKGMPCKIVPSGDVDSLAGALRALITDCQIASAAGIAGRDFVTANFSEERYVAEFSAMVDQVAGN